MEALTTRSIVALAIIAGLFLSSSRDAEAKETVVVRGGDAVQISETKLAELVHLELGDKADAIESVIIDVSNRAAISITIKQKDGIVRTGQIDGSKGGDDPDRTIALFVGELSREPAKATPKEVPPSSPSPPTKETPERPPPPPSNNKPASNPTQVAIGGTTRVIGIGTTGSAIMFGPTVAASLGLGERIRLGVLGRATFASADDRLGTVNVVMLGGGVDAAYRVLSSESFAIDTGPRFALSWIGGSGEGSQASTTTTTQQRDTSALGVEGAWFIDASIVIARPLFASLGAEAGWLGPGLDLRADQRRIVRIAGAFAGATLSIGLVF